jgi:hypothetical protein
VRDNERRNDTLRVTGRTLELGAEFGRTEGGALAINDVLSELGETDEGEGDGAGGEVGGFGAGGGVLKPLEGVERMLVDEGRRLGGGEGDKVLGSGGEEGVEERRVKVEEGLCGIRSMSASSFCFFRTKGI